MRTHIGMCVYAHLHLGFPSALRNKALGECLNQGQKEIDFTGKRERKKKKKKCEPVLPFPFFFLLCLPRENPRDLVPSLERSTELLTFTFTDTEKRRERQRKRKERNTESHRNE